MKNLKAILFIILGSFFLATGFAFAGGPALDQLKSDPFNAPGSGTPSLTIQNKDNTEIKPTEVKPEPTAIQKVGAWIKGNKRTILLTGVGCFMGWAIFGTAAAILTGGLGVFLLVAMMAM